MILWHEALGIWKHRNWSASSAETQSINETRTTFVLMTRCPLTAKAAETLINGIVKVSSISPNPQKKKKKFFLPAVKLIPHNN